jgi:inosose dehydratase
VTDNLPSTEVPGLARPRFRVGSAPDSWGVWFPHDPRTSGLCLDTGHVAYTQGDAPRLIREHADRIWCVHLEAVDPGVLARAEAEQLSFADAVKRDVMCEPGLGVPDLDDLTDALGSLPAGTFVIVEQDLYPCDFDRPYPIATRPRKTLQAAGIG